MGLDRVRTEITSNSPSSLRPGAPSEASTYGVNSGNTLASLPGSSPSASSLKDAIASVERVRRTTLVNQFLQQWMRWWAGLLIALLAVAAFAHSVRSALIAGATLVAVGAAVSVIVARMRRPSVYRAACLLDAAGGLQDRLSTAIYFANSEDPDGMLTWQREDALARASGLNLAALFPVRMPSVMRRVAVLALIAAGFLGYRVNHQAPVPQLAHRLAETRVAKTVITPELKAMEKDVAAALGLEEKSGFEKELRQGRQQGDEHQPGDADASASLQDVSADKSDLTNGNLDLQGENAEKSQDMSNQQQNAQGVPQQGEPVDGQPDQDSANQQQQPGSSQSAAQNQQAGQQSLTHTLMQALKDMVSKATGQQSGQSQGQNSPNAQQSSNQNTPSNADSNNEQKGSADANGNASQDGQQPGQSVSDQKPQGTDGTEQAGNTPGSNRIQKNAALDSKTSADKVDLNYSDPSGGTRVRATAGPGIAQVPLTGASAAPVAAVNGAEQESIPQRYRMYVQHYFDHAAKPQH